MKSKISEATEITHAEMIEFIDQPLMDGLGEAIKVRAAGEPITVSAVELTILGTLAVELGESCETVEVLEVQARAYFELLMNIAGSVIRGRQQRESMN